MAIAGLVAVVLLIGTGGGTWPAARAGGDDRGAQDVAPAAWLPVISAGSSPATIWPHCAPTTPGWRGVSSTTPTPSWSAPAPVQNQVPKGYSSIPILSYASLRSFVSDVHSGAVDPRIAAVLYDPEDWSRTPAKEQREPVAAMREFTSFAGDWGYGALLAPGRDLALDAGLAVPQGKSRTTRPGVPALRSGGGGGRRRRVRHPDRAGGAAAGTDGCPARCDPSAPAQGQRATPPSSPPSSTAPPGEGEQVWPVDLLRAAERAVKHGAGGLMLNFAAGEVDLVASFLRDLERTGPIAGIVTSRPGRT